MLVAASDENLYDEALETWRSFGADAKAAVGRVNVHGYQQATGQRSGLHHAVSQDFDQGTAATAASVAAAAPMIVERDYTPASSSSSSSSASASAYSSAAAEEVVSRRQFLWQSEYGEGDRSGLSLAANLNLDL